MDYVTMKLDEQGFEHARGSMLIVDFGCTISTELAPDEHKIFVYTRDLAKINCIERYFGLHRIETTW